MSAIQLTETFEQNKPQLKSYILRITASIEDTEDIIQDTYIKALEKLDTYKGISSLKTWIFTIASNLAKDNLRAKKRWVENVSDVCKDAALSNPDYFPQIMQLQQTSPYATFEIKEHITFCLTCISKSLPLEQHICLFLKEVYEFKISEIAEIMDTNEAMVKYHLHTARSKMIRIFDKRCALINKTGTCHQCSELNGIFNPQQNFEIEKNKLELVKSAKSGDKENLFNLRLQIMRETDPFNSKGSDLQLHHLEHNRQVMENF